MENYTFTHEELLALKKKWSEEAWEASLKYFEYDFYYIKGRSGYADEPDKQTYLDNLTIE